MSNKFHSTITNTRSGCALQMIGGQAGKELHVPTGWKSIRCIIWYRVCMIAFSFELNWPHQSFIASIIDLKWRESESSCESARKFAILRFLRLHTKAFLVMSYPVGFKALPIKLNNPQFNYDCRERANEQHKKSLLRREISVRIWNCRTSWRDKTIFTDQISKIKLGLLITNSHSDSINKFAKGGIRCEKCAMGERTRIVSKLI